MSSSLPSWMTSAKSRNRVLLIAALTVAILLLLRAAWAALVPFFFGLVFAYLMLPVVNYLDTHAPRFLRRWGWSRPLAIVLVYLACLGLVAGLLTVFIPTVSEQASYLIEATPALFRRLEGLLSHDLVDLLERIPPEIAQAVNASLDKASTAVMDAVRMGVEVTLRTLFQTVSFIFGLVIVPFWLFYVLNDESKVRSAFYGLIPEVARADVRCIMHIIDRLLSAYVRGQFLLCLSVGGAATIALLAFGIREALLLGTLAGILEAVPYLGPFLGAVPPVLIALGTDPMRAVWVAVTFTGIQQVENIFLVPRISGNAVRFHPAVVMVIVVIGAEVAGVWGLLLSVPLSAIVRDVFRYLYLRTTERGATPEAALEILRLTMI
jgi:predicted PurR-regulated permease PerM